jgi:hypothetical protein
MAATTLPCAFVFKSDEVTEAIAKFVVVAWVVVDRRSEGKNWSVPRVVVAFKRLSTRASV